MDYVDRLRGRTQNFNLSSVLKFTDMQVPAVHQDNAPVLRSF